MSNPAFTLEGDTLTLEGLLSVETVSQYQSIGNDALAKAAKGLVVDLGVAEIIGSAPIALLIAWQRRAISLDKSYELVNAPPHFLEIARVSGVLEILPFTQIS